MSEAQRKLEQMVTELNRYQAQMDALRSNIESVEAQINQITVSGVTLDGISKAEEGQEILVPIGANSFVFAKVRDVNRVIVGIGSDVAVESTIEKAQERLGTRLRELREVAETLQKQYRNTAQRVEELRAQVQQTYNEMQQ